MISNDIMTLVDQMKQAGVPLSHRHYPGVIHGFFSMSLILDAGQRAVSEAAAAMRSVLLGSGDAP